MVSPAVFLNCFFDLIYNIMVERLFVEVLKEKSGVAAEGGTDKNFELLDGSEEAGWDREWDGLENILGRTELWFELKRPGAKGKRSTDEVNEDMKLIDARKEDAEDQVHENRWSVQGQWRRGRLVI